MPLVYRTPHNAEKFMIFSCNLCSQEQFTELGSWHAVNDFIKLIEGDHNDVRCFIKAAFTKVEHTDVMVWNNSLIS
jgi:hypothetical protein